MRISIGVALMLLACPAVAQVGDQACPAVAVALPAPLTGWADRVPIAPGADLTIGQAAEAPLRPPAAITYAVAPEKPGRPESHGGVLAFAVATPGVYRVALSAGAWIDVVRDGKAVASSAHGHGPACSGIRKMVDFRLTAGRHLLQIASSEQPTIAVMVVPLP